MSRQYPSRHCLPHNALLFTPPDIRRLLVEDSTKDRRSPLLNTARQAYPSMLTCGLWHQTPTGQALIETGWTAMAKLELSWWNHFSRPSVTRLSRFISGHFPTRVYCRPLSM